ncbi:MAG TPA: type III pantothenate kinase [Gammaproteobacteria bacterium]|nr:type III pantothenate kinase [Gammaproteobacteria bacterium]
MSVVIDIGNARIKWAQVQGGRLVAPGQALHLEAFDAAFDALAAALPKSTDRVVVANVAGDKFATRLEQLTRARFQLAPELVATSAEQYGVRCAYADPSRLGVDRWIAVIAAHHLAEGAACVINAGTAVTFDAVDQHGQHLGGLIFPGARLMAAALDRNTSNIGATSTAGLPPAGLDLLGKNTDTAVGHAAMLSVAAALDRAIETVSLALATRPTVFLAGGDGPVLSPWLETEVQLRADLVLEGLALFIRQSRPQDS